MQSWSTIHLPRILGKKKEMNRDLKGFKIYLETMVLQCLF